MLKYISRVFLILLFTFPAFAVESEEMILVPVLKEAMGPGQIIQQSDVDLIDLPASKINKYTIAEIDQLVGKTPKRFLKANETIRHREVKDPIMVERKNLVTIVLKSSRMLLTAQGQAMESGAEGDVIRVMNINSRKVVAGRIVSANRVDVVLSNQLALHE